MLLEPVAHADDLADAIVLGDDREDGFVEGAAEDLNLSGFGAVGEAAEVDRVVGLDPFEEGAGVMQGRTEVWVFFEEGHEGLVGLLEGLLEDAVEVSDGLVVV